MQNGSSDEMYDHYPYEDDNVTKRQEDIVNWLSSSKYIVALQDNKGFYISGQTKGRLKDGRIVNVIDWLYWQGIKNGRKRLQYRLRYDRVERRLYFLIE